MEKIKTKNEKLAEERKMDVIKKKEAELNGEVKETRPAPHSGGVHPSRMAQVGNTNGW